MLKRRIALVMALMLLCVSMSSCKKTTTGDGSKENEIEVTFSFWEPGVKKDVENSLAKISKEYEKEHPNVKIKLLSQPVSGYQEWIKAQIVADNLPDIESNYGPNLIEQYKGNYIVDISKDLSSPNKYNGNEIWKDTFIDGKLELAHEYKYKDKFAIPLFGTGLAVYYNKTMYDELGLKVPKTWEEFMSNCSKIEKSKKTPIAFMSQKEAAVIWMSWELTGGLLAQKLFGDPNINYNGDCNISEREVIKSIKTGYMDFANNKDFQDMFKIYIEKYKEFLKYAPDASGLDEAAAKTMFLSGQAGHIHTGSWDIQGLLKSDEVNFEVGTFEFPTFTKTDSPYAGKGMNVSSVQPLAITSNVNKVKGKKEAAVDFLKYLTSKDVYSGFIEATSQIPVIKDVKVDSVFKEFMKDGYSPINLFQLGSDKEGETFKNVVNSIIVGEDVKLNNELFAKIQKSLVRYADDEIAKGAITPENDYKISELPEIGGKFKAE